MDEILYSPSQRKIIEGLAMFGEDVVGFYLSGVAINHSKFEVKSHLLAHKIKTEYRKS